MTKNNKKQKTPEVMSSSDSPSGYDTMARNYDDWEDLMSSSAEKPHDLSTTFKINESDKDGLASLDCTVYVYGKCTGGPVGYRHIVKLDKEGFPLYETYLNGKTGKSASVEIISLYVNPEGGTFYDPIDKKTKQAVRVTWTVRIADLHDAVPSQRSSRSPNNTSDSDDTDEQDYVRIITRNSSQNGLHDPVLVCG